MLSALCFLRLDFRIRFIIIFIFIIILIINIRDKIIDVLRGFIQLINLLFAFFCFYITSIATVHSTIAFITFFTKNKSFVVSIYIDRISLNKFTGENLQSQFIHKLTFYYSF